MLEVADRLVICETCLELGFEERHWRAVYKHSCVRRTGDAQLVLRNDGRVSAMPRHTQHVSDAADNAARTRT